VPKADDARGHLLRNLLNKFRTGSAPLLFRRASRAKEQAQVVPTDSTIRRHRLHWEPGWLKRRLQERYRKYKIEEVPEGTFRHYFRLRLDWLWPMYFGWLLLLCIFWKPFVFSGASFPDVSNIPLKWSTFAKPTVVVAKL
jgi:hypothetical protein